MNKITLALTCCAVFAVMTIIPVRSHAVDLGYYSSIVASSECSQYSQPNACRTYLSYRFDKGYNKNQAKMECEHSYCNSDAVDGPERHACWDVCTGMLGRDK